MPFLMWNNDYSVGVETFDADHIVLISLLNHLYDARQAGSGEQALGAILGALVNYANTHFRREETRMRESRYPGFEQHKKLHDALLEQIEDIQNRYLEDGPAGLSDEVLEFLKSWLNNHILREDMHYKPFFAHRE